MGLDQTLTVLRDIGEDGEHCFTVKVYSFKEANALQGYFEKIYDTQNLEEHEVSMDSIIEIKKYTDYILKNPEDIDYIEKNFSPTRGFLYGSAEIDEWYFEEVETVSKAVNEILNDDKVSKIFYTCWW